ncbi:DNA cross-link repair 1A protein [Pelodytes ibericus]
MSENEMTEDNIWDYKSIRKSKLADSSAVERARPHETQKSAKNGSQLKVQDKKNNTLSNGDTGPAERHARKNQTNTGKQHGDKKTSQGKTLTPRSKKADKKQSPRTPTPRHSGYCPSCQMPFSALLVQTPRWHVSECLDTPGSAANECPSGITCTSTLPSHYKKFTHYQLAQSRAVDDIYAPIPPSPETSTPSATDRVNHEITENNNFNLHPSNPSPAPNIITRRQKRSQSPASSQDSVKQTSLNAWLLSPSKNGTVGGALSQESLNDDHPSCLDAVFSSGVSQPTADLSDCEISYSPLHSEEDRNSDDKNSTESSLKRLFPPESSEDEVHREQESLNERQQDKTNSQSNGGNSENFAKDSRDLMFAFSERIIGQPSPSAANQPESEPITEEGNWSTYSSPALDTGEWDTAKGDLDDCFLGDWDNNICVSSTQVNKEPFLAPGQSEGGESVCLEEIRRQNKSSNPQCSSGISGFGPTVTGEKANIASSQCSTVMSSGASGLPAKGMKQMDIGLFFGLKPKVEKEMLPLKSQNLNEVTAPVPGKKPVQRKRKAQGSVGDTDSVIANPPNPGAAGSQKRWGKKSWQNSTGEEGKGRAQCPFYKKIPGTGFTVDAFRYGQIEGCSAYFLTHFHSDHYGGLTKKFRYPIYCNKITANLVQSKLRVEKEFINVLPMETECMVDNIKVVLLDANHCPGAALLLFILPTGTTILHTGDFRADPSMEKYPALIGRKIHSLYLDTTYCSPEYTFPPQQEAIQFAVNTAFEMVTLYPRTLVVCGTYSVGKEKVFLAIADVLGCKVSMSQDKYKTMLCLESDEIRSLVTTDWHSTSLHVLPMMTVNFKGLYSHLNKFSGKYDRVLAFKPTGWTYSDQCNSVADIKPEVRGKVTLYGIPYSEHSSYLEMKRFVQWCRPQKIIPTVNIGNPNSRSTMEKYFREWNLDHAKP